MWVFTLATLTIEEMGAMAGGAAKASASVTEVVEAGDGGKLGREEHDRVRENANTM